MKHFPNAWQARRETFQFRFTYETPEGILMASIPAMRKVEAKAIFKECFGSVKVLKVESNKRSRS